MEKVLIIRLSAMGDVAMTVPVLQQLVQKYPNSVFHLLTRSAYFPIFQKCVPTLQLVAIDPYLNGGILGIYMLYKFLRPQKFSAIADLHNVMRTKILRLLFRNNKCQWVSLDKKRKQRKALMARRKTRPLQPLPAVYELYQEVFEKLNFPIQLTANILKKIKKQTEAIGIAPYSKHETKNWREDNNQKLMDYLLENTTAKIYLFGDANKEGKQLSLLASTSDRIQTTFHLSFEAQINLIETLDFMISMDSANMHLASAVGTEVISVWCATSPLAGFLGFGQSESNAIQTNLACRPCSIYGNKKCWRGDLACTEIPMNEMETVLNKVIC